MTAEPMQPATRGGRRDPRRFRFGVEMMGPFDGMTWVESVRELESLGYSTLFAPDHLDEGYGPITAMATAAMVTTRLTVATAVFAADFRHPVVLARELASIDVLSGGRLEVGLGAGYQVNDYLGSGIAMDSPKIRVERLMEHVAVLRGLFAGGPFSFHGDHYDVAELDATPAPHTPGGPPIFVAGGGRRMLRFAARHADIVGVNVLLPSSEDRGQSHLDAAAHRIDEKFDWIREAAGPRLDELVFHAWLKEAVVTERAGEVAEAIAQAIGVRGDVVLASPLMLVGSVGEIVERLQERRERWEYSYYTVQQAAALAFAPVVARLADA